MKTKHPISSAIRKFSLVFLGLFIFAGCARPDQTAAASDDTAAVRLTVELSDGSRVVGQGVDKSFPFHSVLLGNLDLAMKDIRSIECLTTNSAKLTTTGGDVLTVGFAKSELQLQTGFGKVELPVASVRRLTVSAPRAAAKPIDGLVALWSAEGNTDDSVGNRHGQLEGQAGYAPGKIGQAFAFHSSGDGVTAAATGLPVGNSDRTIDCWIYIDAYSPGILGFVAGYGDEGGGRLFCFGVGRDHRIFFTQWGDAIYGSTLLHGQWYNIAVTSSGTDSIKLYVDGNQVGAGSANFNTPAAGQFWIGGKNCQIEDRQFLGSIDEVAVYNRALSDDEIKSLAEDAAPAKPASAH